MTKISVLLGLSFRGLEVEFGYRARSKNEGIIFKSRRPEFVWFLGAMTGAGNFEVLVQGRWLGPTCER